MSTGVTCLVYVEGERAADGSPGESPTQPAILENLAVTWGRGDTMSQPSPDSCTFSVLDPEGGEAFIGLYRTGVRVDVMAQGTIYPVPETPTFTNPGFETAAVTWAVSGGTAARTTARAHSGANSLAVRASAVAPVSLWLGPGEFQPEGTNPDAWDAIHTASAGQLWTLRAALWLPAGATATVRPALFSGPYSTAATAAGTATVIVGSAGWVDISPELLVDVDGQWVGLNVVMNPVGPAWDQMPPALTWDGVDPSLSWDDMGTMYVDDVDAIEPEGTSTRGVLVFSGRVTDLSASWDSSAGGVIAEVTCQGFPADLDNRLVGDEPWTVESVDARANRILSLAGLPITIDIDSPIDDILISWRDVDSAGATGLLQELAVSVDGVLWSAVHQSIGAYLRLEDPAMREALLKLYMQLGPPAVVQHINQATNPDQETFGAVTTVRTNWLGNPVPASITGYSRAGVVTSTLTYETAGGPAASGGTWIKNAITQVAAGTDNQINLGGQVIGQFRHAGAWVFASKVMSLRIGAWTYDASNNYLGLANDLTTANFALQANTWTYVQGVTTGAPTAYSRFQPFLRVVAASGVQSPDVYGIAMATLSDVPGAGFTGSTPAAGDFTYAWSGAVNGSSSLQRAPNMNGVSAFSGGNGTRWSSITEHDTGARSLACVQAIATTGQTGFIWFTAAVLAGQWVSGIIRVKAAAGLALQFSVRTSAGGAATGAGQASFTTTGEWQTVSVTAQAATDGALLGVQIVTRAPIQAGVPFFVDRLIAVVEPNPYTGPYFDGDTPDTSTANYGWTGAAHASTSTQSTVQTRTIVIIPTDPSTGFDLSACVILRDPVTWVQDVSDVITRTSVSWKVQGVDDEGNPTTTEATERAIDATLETRYGTRNASVSTQLQAAADAQEVASKVLARATPQGWRATGIAIDDDDVTGNAEGVALMLDLLDGTSRIGAPITIGDLPDWSPAGASAGVYLEGGTYRYVGGRWVLELVVSAAGSGLGESAQWDQLDPAWTWNEWEPAMTWNDLRGVGAP